MSNLEEFTAGTVPTDSASVLRITDTKLQAPSSELTITWQSAADKTYGIEKSTNLAEGFTVTEASGISATPPENTHTVTAGGENGFYRVRVE